MNEICPPYYAVIFTSRRNVEDDEYEEVAARMVELASHQPGFLGFYSAREEVGITVSYWRDLASIKNWHEESEHRRAQELGYKKFYSYFQVEVAKIERRYEFQSDRRGALRSKS